MLAHGRKRLLCSNPIASALDGYRRPQMLGQCGQKTLAVSFKFLVGQIPVVCAGKTNVIW